jgi:hydroxymethylglutaryl-CoA synthase
LGNIYTGSLYTGLLALVCDPEVDVSGKTVMMFSYGSGCAASMYTVRAVGDLSKLRKTASFK